MRDASACHYWVNFHWIWSVASEKLFNSFNWKMFMQIYCLLKIHDMHIFCHEQKVWKPKKRENMERNSNEWKEMFSFSTIKSSYHYYHHCNHILLLNGRKTFHIFSISLLEWRKTFWNDKIISKFMKNTRLVDNQTCLLQLNRKKHFGLKQIKQLFFKHLKKKFMLQTKIVQVMCSAFVLTLKWHLWETILRIILKLKTTNNQI